MTARVIAGARASIAPAKGRAAFTTTARRIAADVEDARNEGRREGIRLVLERAIAESDRVDDLTALVVSATRAVCERALGHTLAIDDEALGAWARTAIEAAPKARAMTMRASPQTASRLRARLSSRGSDAITSLDLVGDASLADDELAITSTSGDLVTSVALAIEPLLAALKPSIATAIASNRAPGSDDGSR